jgi:hypothetical protein
MTSKRALFGLLMRRRFDMETSGAGITRWFKYDRDCLCVNKSQFVPVIFEPPCILTDDNITFFLIDVLIIERNSSCSVQHARPP